MGLGAGFTVCEQTYSIIYIVEYIVEGNKESHQERHFIKKRALIRKGDVSSWKTRNNYNSRQCKKH